MSKIKVALIGTGNMGRNHLRVLQKSSEFVVSYVVDPQIDSSLAINPNIKILNSIDELPFADIHGAIVATPTETHFKIVMKLLHHKVHTLVEKPAASTFEEATILAETANNLGVTLAVGNIERCNPVIDKLESVLQSGVIGVPVHFSTMRGGGFPRFVKPGNNVILDLAVHDLDVLSRLLGSLTVTHVLAHQNTLQGIYDTAEISVRSEEGISGSVHANWLSPQKIRSIKVFGTEGVCEVDYLTQSCSIFGQQLRSDDLERPFTYVDHPFCQQINCSVVPKEPLVFQLSEWYKSLQGKPHRLAQDAQLVESVRLAHDAINLADESFKSISFTGQKWKPKNIIHRDSPLS